MIKILYALIVLGSISVAQASDPLLTCTSVKEDFTLCVYDLSSENWSSILVNWSRSGTCASQGYQATYSRQFVQEEVYSITEEKIEAYQNNRFLGFGRKTSFSLDRRTGTAILSGKNGNDFMPMDGMRATSEKKGRYLMEFNNCR